MSIRRAVTCLAHVVPDVPRHFLQSLLEASLNEPKTVPVLALPRAVLDRAADVAREEAQASTSPTAASQFFTALRIIRGMPSACA